MPNGERFFLFRMLLAAAIVAGLAGSDTSSAPLSHDAYVWQRQWRPAVSEAVRRGADMVAGWRVLGAVVDGNGQVLAVTPDWAALADSGRSVILVVRIDAMLGRVDAAQLFAGLRAQVERWRAAGVPLAGLEIDHDSPTARLGQYADFLRQVRREFPLPLSVTALPTWLDAKAFDEVVDVADEVVLQVHAVRRPAQGEGLFSPAAAMVWQKRMAVRSAKPFRLALPAYGTRIGRDEDGSVVAVESESPVPGGTHSEELMAAPAEVRGLLDELGRNHARNLTGIVWFRLPNAADRRAWSLATLRAVIAGMPMDGKAHVMVERGEKGASLLVLANTGAIDVRLPRRLILPAGCGHADGANGYQLTADGGTLVRVRDGVLHEGRRMAVGWARCELKGEEVHVEP